MLFISSLYNAVIVVRMALKNKENTIPDKIIVVFDMPLSTVDANFTIANTVPIPHKKPIIGIVNFPMKGIENPVTISNPTPRDAPEDTPKVYGDASGFLSTDWTTAPLTESEPPTIKANKTLGNLKFQIIATSLLSIHLDSEIPNTLCPIIDKISLMLVLALPIDVPKHIIKNTIKMYKVM